MTDDLSSQLTSLRIDRNSPRHASARWRWILSLGVLGSVGVGLYAKILPELNGKVFRTTVAVTEVTSVSPAEGSVQLTSAGYVVAQRVSHVAPKIAGRVAQVLVSEGQLVQPGQVLLTLDSTDDQASLEAARSRAQAVWARAGSARAQVATLQSEFEEGRQQAEREQRLAHQGAVPPSVADDLTAHVKSLQARVSAAQAEAAAVAAEARAQNREVAASETRLENLILRTPILGTVTTRPPQPGEVLTPQPPGVSADMGSVEITDLESLMVETDVPEQRLNMVTIGAPTEIVLDAFPSRRFRGKVTEVTPKLNRSKASVVVRVEFVDDKQGALPEMSARVNFLTKPIEPDSLRQPLKIIVPSAAVTDRAGMKAVFVLEDGMVRLAPVTLGPSFGGGFEVIQGPRPGTRLVAYPPETLADGSRVKEKEAE